MLMYLQSRASPGIWTPQTLEVALLMFDQP